MTVEVGDVAPAFTLPGTEGTAESRRDYKLADHLGRPVLLVFYPVDDTVVCTRQLNAYTREIDAFREVDAQILAISPQSIESHDAFHEKQGGFAFPLLADQGKEVGRQYGVLGPVGFYRRSVFLVDGEGIVRYRHRAVAGLTLRAPQGLGARVRAGAC
jgi:thioredoxin-dependent peroxiredoxin